MNSFHALMTVAGGTLARFAEVNDSSMSGGREGRLNEGDDAHKE